MSPRSSDLTLGAVGDGPTPANTATTDDNDSPVVISRSEAVQGVENDLLGERQVQADLGDLV
jgi:hypothetical protein